LLNHKIVSNKVFSGASLYVPGNFRKFKSLGQRTYDVCYIGSLSTLKNIHLLLVALRILKKAGYRYRAALAGEGGDLHRSLKDLIRILNIDDMVSYLGVVLYNQVPVLLNECKTLILPSKSEGVPNIILEATACGTVPIATPVGGIPDIIKEGVTGFILESVKPVSIAFKLASILSDMTRLELISSEAQKYVMENYSFKAVVRRWKDVFMRLLKA